MKKIYILILSCFILSSFSEKSLAEQEPKGKNDEIEALKFEIQQMQKDIEEMRQNYETERKNQETKLEALQEKVKDLIEAKSIEKDELRAEIAKALIEEKPSIQPSYLYSARTGDSTFKPEGSGWASDSPTQKLMDISFDSLFTMGGSTARESGIDKLQGGAHDPKKKGFTTQNLELSLLGAVDPYLNAEAHLVFQINKDGESKLEVEEAFLTTQSLPHGLQIKAGTYFTEFGRLNFQHPHTWSFMDQPIINTRMFGGDGLRGPGARLSWLTPLPWYSEFFLGAQNANGETAFSFLSKAGGAFSGHTIKARDVRSLEDMLYSTRWLNSFSLSDEVALNFGASALFGPNATGNDNRTNIYGTDIYLKWKPLSNDRGFPFVAWQTELMKRDYEAGESKDSLDDWGLYSQFLWGFKRNWVWGIRYDLADGNGALTDYLRDRRHRVSPNLTWYPTEFSKVRFQYNYDKAEHINDSDGDEHSVWLQFEFMLGSHPKHKF
mgnify:CR=1 FL=1